MITHVFVLTLFMQGAEVRGAPMYFYDIDRCLYFSEKMSKQKDFSAICKPVQVDTSQITVYR